MWLEVAIISPWKEAWPLNWSNLNPLFPKDFLCQVWLNFALWFWRLRFKRLAMYFLIFCYYWKKSMAFIEKTWIHYRRMLCAKSGWIDTVVLEKKTKMWKDSHSSLWLKWPQNPIKSSKNKAFHKEKKIIKS